MPSALARMLTLAAVLLAGAPAVAAAQAPATAEYTILIYERDADLAARTSPTAGDAYWSAYDAFAADLMKAGVLRGGSALDEHVQVTVRGTGGADRGVKGARLGGYFVIAVPDRAAAEAWARKAPKQAVAVEVRPHRANPHMAASASMAPPHQ